MSVIRIEIDETKLKELVFRYFREKLGDVDLEPKSLEIQVKSRQNYKSEWETAEFRAVYSRTDF